MRLVNRVFVGGLIIVAVLWVGLYVTDLRQRAADATFYRDHVVKSLSGDPQKFDTAALSEWLNRTQRHGDNVWHRTILFLTAGGWVLGWSVLMLIRNEVFWKRRNATERPADPEAGAVIREARNYGSVLTARTAKAGLHLLPVRPRDLEINFAKREVVLRGFTFITDFMGNKRAPEITGSIQRGQAGSIQRGQADIC